MLQLHYIWILFRTHLQIASQVKPRPVDKFGSFSTNAVFITTLGNIGKTNLFLEA